MLKIRDAEYLLTVVDEILEEAPEKLPKFLDTLRYLRNYGTEGTVVELGGKFLGATKWGFGVGFLFPGGSHVVFGGVDYSNGEWSVNS